MGVGTRLKSILKEKNVTIKELSIMADVSLNTLYGVTKRDNNTLDPDILRRISSTLSIPVQYLLGFSVKAPDLNASERVIMEDINNTSDGLLEQIIQLSRSLNTNGRLLCVEYLKKLEKKPEYRSQENEEFLKSLENWSKQDLQEIDLMLKEGIVSDSDYQKLKIMLTKHIGLPFLIDNDIYREEDERLWSIIESSRERRKSK